LFEILRTKRHMRFGIQGSCCPWSGSDSTTTLYLCS